MKKFETISATELIELATRELRAQSYLCNQHPSNKKDMDMAEKFYTQLRELGEEVDRLTSEKENAYDIPTTDKIKPLNSISDVELLKHAHSNLYRNLCFISEELNNSPNNEVLQHRESKYFEQLKELQKEIREIVKSELTQSGCCVEGFKTMEKYTMNDLKAFERAGDGRLLCPTGDYRAIREFGNNCIFDDYSVFDDYTIFGVNCAFGAECSFGTKCIFGTNCTFGNGCTFGDDCSFAETPI